MNLRIAIIGLVFVLLGAAIYFTWSSPTAIGEIILPISIAYFIFSIGAFFSSPITYKRWVIFSVIYGIVISILLVTIPELGYGMGGFGFTLLDTRGFAVLYAALYGLLSVALLSTSEIIERSERVT